MTASLAQAICLVSTCVVYTCVVYIKISRLEMSCFAWHQHPVCACSCVFVVCVCVCVSHESIQLANSSPSIIATDATLS